MKGAADEVELWADEAPHLRGAGSDTALSANLPSQQTMALDMRANEDRRARSGPPYSER